MQCVMDCDAQGYEEVESGSVTTGASVWVQGILVSSQGSKQKVELKVNKILLVSLSIPFNANLKAPSISKAFAFCLVGWHK